MEADNSSDFDSAGEESAHYCSVSEAVKLITHPFEGDKRKLREFIENVDIWTCSIPRDGDGIQWIRLSGC
jgi:hypothetical protein